MQKWVVLAIFGAEKGLFFFLLLKMNLVMEWSSKTSSHTELNCVKYKSYFHIPVLQLKLYFKGKLYKNEL